MKYTKAVTKTRVIGLVLGAVAILAAVGAGAISVLWKERTKPAQKAVVAQTAPPVVDLDISLEGKIQARHIVPVGAPVAGKVDVFHVEVGQEIFEGQLL